MTDTTPHVILVPGAWHGAWAYEALLTKLEQRGLPATAIDLPSVGRGGDLAADADVVRAAIEATRGPCVLVGHSYGGIPITEASAGRADVTHLVYLCAFQLDVGDSLLGALNNQLLPWIKPQEDGLTTLPETTETIFYGDVAAADLEAAQARIAPHTISSMAAELTGAGWHDIPSTYVICEQDQAIPPPAQEAMAQRATNVIRLQSSHSPFLSQPDKVADILAEVAGAGVPAT